MGDRGQINYKYSNAQQVMLYTHWDGTELPQTLAQALDRGRERWDDEVYLARIIFSEMVKDSLLDTTGYGIGVTDMGPDHRPILVDAGKGLVWHEGRDWRYEEFVDAFRGESKPPQVAILDAVTNASAPLDFDALQRLTGLSPNVLHSTLHMLRYNSGVKQDEYGRWIAQA